MTVIDFHNHFYPVEYLQAVQRGPSVLKYHVDDDGNPCLSSPGDVNVIVPGHRDIDYRTEVIAKVGVDKQILTFTAPATHVEAPEQAVPMACFAPGSKHSSRAAQSLSTFVCRRTPRRLCGRLAGRLRTERG